MTKLIYIFLATWPLYAEWTIIDLGPGNPAVDILRPFVLLLVLGTYFYLLIHRKKIVISRVMAMGLIFILYFLLHILLKETGRGLLSAIVDLFQKFLLPILILYVLINNRDRLDDRKTAYAILLSGLYIAGVGILEFIAGGNLIGKIGFADSSSTLYRTNGPFHDGIGFAGIVLTFVPFAYYVLKKQLVNRPFAVFCIIFFSIGSLINYSRTIWLGLLLISIILFMPNSVRGVLLSFYLMLLFAILAYFSYNVIMESTILKKRFADSRNIVSRFNQYKNAINIILDHPFWGIGYEMYRKTHPLYLHNSYLRTFVEFGLFGMLSFFVYVFTMLFQGLKKTMMNDGIYGLKTRLAVMIIVLLIPNTIDFLYNANFQLFLAILIFTLTSHLFKDTEKEVTISDARKSF